MGFSLLMEEQNKDTGRRLVIATALMFTCPFIGFFIARLILFRDFAEPDNWAGGVAIVVTNIIVGGYCYMALTEKDDDDGRAAPRVGVFKERVD